MFTKAQIYEIARRQSARDLGCNPEDFTAAENRVVLSKADPGARKYLTLPFYFQLVSYGQNIVASVAPEFEAETRSYLSRYAVIRCFQTPHLHVIDETLKKHGQRVCFMAEYSLPDPARLTVRDCPYPVRILGKDDFAPLYTPEWSNALSKDRPQLDAIGAGAYDGGRLVGLAGASADCETMWQIGIDVLPEYRRQGIAAALVSRLAAEILAAGIVPFYCCAWSNLASLSCALESGFRPAWVELTAKPTATVDGYNGTQQ